MEFRIEGARALVHGRLEDTQRLHLGSVQRYHRDLHGYDGRPPPTPRPSSFFPEFVDVHGDAFECQVMPRPRVAFPLDIALLESDRQAVSNGITTVFHGVTLVVGARPARCRERARHPRRHRAKIPRLGADTRYHLRHETYNLDAEPEINEWLAGGRIDAIAFNDHMSGIVESADRAHKLAPTIDLPD